MEAHMTKLIMLVLLAAGCGDTGQVRVSYPVSAVGKPAAFTSGAWQVTLDVARLGVGPLYFCATATASEDLCPVAVNELLETVEIDALAAAPQPLGMVMGVTGFVKSAMFDYGINWFATEAVPRASTSFGHSAHFEGRAERAGTTRRFVADVDVVPQYQGSLAVNGARAVQDIVDPPAPLVLSVDPASIFAQVDFDELDQIAGDPARFEASSRAHNAIVVRLVGSALPRFEWSSP
jgi:hypothetical protein